METKKRVAIVRAYDWQGLYIDGKLIDEDHKLGSGDTLYMLKMGENYSFNSNDVINIRLSDADIESTENSGSFPQLLTDFIDVYQ